WAAEARAGPIGDWAGRAGAGSGPCHYPPTGYRSAGGVMTSPGGPFCLVMVESQAALADLDKTLAVPGVDGIYVGPRDLSYSLGCEMAPDDPVFWGALQQIWAACRAAGKAVGVHSTDGATARLYRENGCRLLNVASDARAISRNVETELAAARG